MLGVAEAAAEDGAGSKSASSEEKRPEALAIGGRRFCLVPTALEMLEMLEGYCDFMATAPGFGNEVAHRVVELIKVGSAAPCGVLLRGDACHDRRPLDCALASVSFLFVPPCWGWSRLSGQKDLSAESLLGSKYWNLDGLLFGGGGGRCKHGAGQQGLSSQVSRAI